MHRVAFLVTLLASVGCHDASSSGPGSGTMCSGSVIGSDVSFIRAGFCPRTTLSLSFSPTVLPGCATPPDGGVWVGMISTNDGVRAPELQAFQCALVLPVSTIEHDALSSFEFPGDGRIRNDIYVAARSDGEPMCGGRDVTSYVTLFVSHSDDGDIDVRVLGGNGVGGGAEQGCTDPDAGVPRDLFGVFSLDCN